MKTRLVLACLCLAVGAYFLFGCAENTDVDKKLNEDYHNHVTGRPPPPGAMQPKGPPVGPFANSGGIPPGTSAAAAGVTKGPAPSAPK